MRYADKGSILTLAELVALRLNGVDGLNPYIDPSRNAKDCTEDFLRDIYTAGLYLGGFFVEDTGGLGTGDPYFTEERGKAHAEYVNARVRQFVDAGLAPAGVRCWYTCDTRIRPESFDAYANGVERSATDVQRPGVYGFEWLLRYIQERQSGGVMRYPNLGPRSFLTYGYARNLVLDGWQNEQDTIEGITVDLSDMFIAGWKPKEEEVADEQTIREWAKQEARVVLANEYGPALEAELQARLADNSTQDVGAAVAASIKAVGAKLAA